MLSASWDDNIYDKIEIQHSLHIFDPGGWESSLHIKIKLRTEPKVKQTQSHKSNFHPQHVAMSLEYSHHLRAMFINHSALWLQS